jgi:hypothetical protein
MRGNAHVCARTIRRSEELRDNLNRSNDNNMQLTPPVPKTRRRLFDSEHEKDRSLTRPNKKTRASDSVHHTKSRTTLLSLDDDMLKYMLSVQTCMHAAELSRLQQTCSRMKHLVCSAIPRWSIRLSTTQKMCIRSDPKYNTDLDIPHIQPKYYANFLTCARFPVIPLRRSHGDVYMYSWSHDVFDRVKVPSLGAFNVETKHYTIEGGQVYYKAVTQVIRYNLASQRVQSIHCSDGLRIRETDERVLIHHGHVVLVPVQSRDVIWYFGSERVVVCRMLDNAFSTDTYHTLEVFNLQSKCFETTLIQKGECPVPYSFTFYVAELLKNTLVLFGFDVGLQRWCVYSGFIWKEIITWKRTDIPADTAAVFDDIFVMNYMLFERSGVVGIKMLHRIREEVDDEFIPCTHRREVPSSEFGHLDLSDASTASLPVCAHCGAKMRRINRSAVYVTDLMLEAVHV